MIDDTTGAPVTFCPVIVDDLYRVFEKHDEQCQWLWSKLLIETEVVCQRK